MPNIIMKLNTNAPYSSSGRRQIFNIAVEASCVNLMGKVGKMDDATWYISCLWRLMVVDVLLAYYCTKRSKKWLTYHVRIVQSVSNWLAYWSGGGVLGQTLNGVDLGS
jgi:hypothetical protein